MGTFPRGMSARVARHLRTLVKEAYTPWTKDEQQIVLTGLAEFGCGNGKIQEDGHVIVGLGLRVAHKIAQMIGTRNELQLRSQTQKHFKRLGRQMGLL